MAAKKSRPKKVTSQAAPAPSSEVDELERPDPAIRPRTEGQRLLLAVPESHSEVARRIGVTRQAVHAWRAGVNARPTDAQRARLEVEYSIPADAWSRAAEQPAAPTEPDEPPGPGPERLSRLEECERMIALLRMAQSGAGKRELAQLVAEESKQIERRDRIERELREAEREREFLEDRMVREHPGFLRAVAAIRSALRPHPAALRDVVRVLDELERGATP